MGGGGIWVGDDAESESPGNATHRLKSWHGFRDNPNNCRTLSVEQFYGHLRLFRLAV